MTQARWIAFLDGELPLPQREALERLLAADSPEGAAARHQLAAIRAVWAQVEQADPAGATAGLADPQLWNQVRARLPRAALKRPATGPAWLARTALASAVAGGLATGVGLGLWLTGDDDVNAADLTQYTSLLDLPRGSLADLYLAQLDADGGAAADTERGDRAPGDAALDGAASPAPASAARGDSAGG